jgi:hypothetical protein
VAKGPVGAPQPGASAGQAVTVSLSGPQQVQAGGQFATQLGLSGPGAASATMELVYDPAFLEVLSKPGPDQTAMLGAGRIRVRLAQPGASGGGQPTAQVSFRAIAKDNVQTTIRVENVEAQDTAGNPFPTTAPPQQALNIQRPAAAEAKPAPPLDTRPETVIDR